MINRPNVNFYKHGFVIEFNIFYNYISENIFARKAVYKQIIYRSSGIYLRNQEVEMLEFV